MENPTRRRPTLGHQLGTAMVDSPNLRDLLKVRERDDEIHSAGHRPPRAHGVTLATVLACEKQSVLPPSSSSSSSSFSSTVATTAPAANSGGRTVLDVIRDEVDGEGRTGLAVRNGNNNRIFWKSFKNRLRLRRSATASSSTTSSAITHDSATRITPSPSPVPLPIPPNATTTTTATAASAVTVEGDSPASPIRVSFMTLLELEETDSRLSFGNPGGQNPHSSSAIAAAMIGVVEEDSEEENEEEEEMGRNRSKKDHKKKKIIITVFRIAVCVWSGKKGRRSYRAATHSAGFVLENCGLAVGIARFAMGLYWRSSTSSDPSPSSSSCS